jgi:hypothetical protein
MKAQLQKIIQVANRLTIKTWEKVALVLLTNKSRHYALQKGPDSSDLHNNYAFFQDFCENHNYIAKKHPIIGWVTDNEEDILTTQLLLDEIFRNITCKTSFNWAVAETVCKVLAYRELKENDTFILPHYFGNSKTLVTYEVTKIFDLWKSMRAFGLTPKEKGIPPILLFRGTDFSLLSRSSRLSILSNFDPKGPGHTIYGHAREEIVSWLKKSSMGGIRPVVWGYSLGGALASFALLSDPDLFSQEYPSYLFNHPGFSQENFEKWSSISKGDLPKSLCFVTDGDIVSKFGLLFGKTLAIKSHKTQPPIQAHTDLQLIQSRVRIKPVDLTRENRSTSRRIYSALHKNTGHIFFNIGLQLFFP